MHGEIITIGNELLSGRTIDLNAWYAAGRLTASGLRVNRITTVGDDPEKASSAIRDAMCSSEFVIITGGLGSTEDDITNEIVAKVLKRPLCLHKEMYVILKRYADKKGIDMSPAIEKMAWMPEGSKLLDPKGYACGFAIDENNVHLYFLPGVPDQMRYLMDKVVIPELLSRYKTLPVLRQRIIKLYGVTEPQIAERLKDITAKRKEFIFGFYPNFPENHITISLRGEDESSVIDRLNSVEDEIRGVLGEYIFATGNDTMESVVGELLKNHNMTLTVAESCTGGLISNLITDVPGSSHYFLGGVVVYSNKSKEKLLGVRPKTLKLYGAVSEQTASEMAKGVLKLMKSHIGVSVTGIAGPEGGTKEKPVGTVYISLATSTELFTRKYSFWGTRRQIKKNTSMMALDWVRRYIHGYPFLSGI